MVFNDTSWFSVVVGAMIVWLSVLTVFVVRTVRHYNRLTQGVTKTGLREVLETVLGKQQKIIGRSEELDDALQALESRVAHHIQHIGIVRFNPFSDTGGSQSFSLALLDGTKSGIIVTSLYARTGNRWYVKEIRDGHGAGVELSKEEELAIKRAGEKGRKPV